MKTIFLPALRSYGWWVGGCTKIITSALLLLFLNCDFESGIWRFVQRGAGAELDNFLKKNGLHTKEIKVFLDGFFGGFSLL